MTIVTATYRNIKLFTPPSADAIKHAAWCVRADTFSNTFRYRAEDGRTARLAPVSQKSLSDLTRKDA